jgi:hypothetical protein
MFHSMEKVIHAVEKIFHAVEVPDFRLRAAVGRASKSENATMQGLTPLPSPFGRANASKNSSGTAEIEQPFNAKGAKGARDASAGRGFHRPFIA